VRGHAGPAIRLAETGSDLSISPMRAALRRRLDLENSHMRMLMNKTIRAAMICAVMAFCMSGISGVAATAPSNVIANVSGRTSISLDGTWNAIVDPLGTGVGGAMCKNAKAKDSRDLVEYDFDTAGTLKVPGDWNTQRDNLMLYEGSVWYEKSFTYKMREHTRVFAYFGAANYRASVCVNGEKVGEHQGGFTPFNFEITANLHDGANFIVVEVNDQRAANGVPGPSTDFWNYGGLTRGVSLVEVPDTFIQDYSAQLAKGSQSEVAGWVKLNGAANAPQQVTLEIPEAGIKQVVTTDGQGYGEFHFPAKLDLWSPEHPKLYEVKLSAAADSVTDQIGFRTIETRGAQILLNGKPIFLRGVSMHEEAPFSGGRIVTLEQDRILLEWAKELGCNYVRMAHYPYNEAMNRLADKMGILVWSEIPVWQHVAFDDPATLANAEDQLRDMIARDHNRASVIFWSVANETPVTPERLVFLKALIDDARSLDPTRLITSASNHVIFAPPDTMSLPDPLAELLDVIGVNEYIGWYASSTSEGPGHQQMLTPEDCDHLHWNLPTDKPIVISEFGAEAPFGNHGDAATRWTEEFQANFYVHQLAMLDRIPSLAGMSPWVLMDFRSPRRYLPGIQDFHNRKGLISDRGQRKQAFYVLQKYYQQQAQSAN
jgi:beta-glucuronidase